MKKHSDYLIKKKDLIMGNGSMTDELFRFYSELFTAQEEFTASCGDLSVYKKFFKSGTFPVLDTDLIVLEEETKSQLSGLMVKLTDLILSMNPGMDFSELKKNFTADADNLLKELLKKDYASLEKKGVENRLALDEFIFVIHNAFKPFMSGLMKESDIKPSKEDWMESTCSFCGYLPDMSKIVESKENQRRLHCSLCENEWEFPRLVCPSCGCSEQSKHGFFEYEENNIYRVYYCDECRHYIKSVRIPKLKEESAYDLAVEDIITSFLDAGMIEKGYKRI